MQPVGRTLALADSPNACFGDLHILVGFDAGNADGTDHMAINRNRDAARKKALQGRRNKRGAATVNHLFKHLGLFAA